VTSTSLLYIVPRFMTTGVTRLLISLLICLHGVLVIARAIFIKLGENGVPSYVVCALSPRYSQSEIRDLVTYIKQKLVL
jgi:hypothetical protein